MILREKQRLCPVSGLSVNTGVGQSCRTQRASHRWVLLPRHLRTQLLWCWAERTAPRTLQLHGGVHPAMAQATSLTLGLGGQGAFISGQNASGKSTFLRMVGLNLVAARAFGICYASQARLPALPVRASMQNEDSLLGGESLYMPELRRARDLVLVSSHNLVLARILAGKLEAFRIDTTSGAPVLTPGVLRDPNGIALRATQGFGARIEDRAAEVARWLSGRLTELDAAANRQAAPGIACA